MGRASLFIAALMSCASLCGAAPAPVPSHAVVFIYHRFGDDRYPTTDTTTAQFKAQLDWLADNIPAFQRFTAEWIADNA